LLQAEQKSGKWQKAIWTIFSIAAASSSDNLACFLQ
jgi:hypothetical protein